MRRHFLWIGSPHMLQGNKPTAMAWFSRGPPSWESHCSVQQQCRQGPQWQPQWPQGPQWQPQWQPPESQDLIGLTVCYATDGVMRRLCRAHAARCSNRAEGLDFLENMHSTAQQRSSGNGHDLVASWLRALKEDRVYQVKKCDAPPGILSSPPVGGHVRFFVRPILSWFVSVHCHGRPALLVTQMGRVCHLGQVDWNLSFRGRPVARG